uniref:Uncharacterized protein n=1 Tax=Timema cristinae TaxID=61476 RepID=A0A7R9D381_TIMCR|nr:unnamed protein product [Timema cristinae]
MIQDKLVTLQGKQRVQSVYPERETRRNSGDIDVVEEVVPLVAGFGKWQFLMAGMLCFSVIPITWNYHAILFLAPSQQGYVCKYPEGLGFENWRLDDWITLSHPKHKVYSKESPNLEQCHMYKLNYSELVNATESEIDSLPTNQSEIIRCSEFLFFPARYGITILQKSEYAFKYSYAQRLSAVVRSEPASDIKSNLACKGT